MELALGCIGLALGLISIWLGIIANNLGKEAIKRTNKAEISQVELLTEELIDRCNKVTNDIKSNNDIERIIWYINAYIIPFYHKMDKIHHQTTLDTAMHLWILNIIQSVKELTADSNESWIKVLSMNEEMMRNVNKDYCLNHHKDIQI